MLRVLLFGTLEAFVGDHQLPRFATRRAAALFAFLVLHRGHAKRRESVAAQFWENLPTDRCRRALNTEVWRIANVVRAAGVDPADLLDSRPDALSFRPRLPTWIDIEAFETTLDACTGINPEQADDALLERLTRTVALYRGDLLEEIFDDWCLVHREALRLRYLVTLEYLMDAHMARKAWQRAIEVGGRLLAADPLQEHVHRSLMRCHYHLGNRPAAVRQFAICREILRDELGIEPMEETTRVHETIIAIAPPTPRAHTADTESPFFRPPAARRTPLQEVNLAIANIDTARGWLIDAGRQLSDPKTS